MSQWYDVTADHVASQKGSSLLEQCYNGSLMRALSCVLHDHDWEWWRSADHSVQNEFWQQQANHHRFLQYLQKAFKVYSSREWHSITITMVKKLRGGNDFLQQYNGSFSRALGVLLPDVVWEFWPKFGKAAPPLKSVQKRLKLILENLGFEDLEVEHRSEVMVSASTKKAVVLDFYSSSKKITFEYQGEHHFLQFKCGFPGQSLEHKQSRDSEKQRLCEQHGITLITIPYWWDRTEASVIDAIEQKRPELFAGHRGYHHSMLDVTQCAQHHHQH